MSEAAAVHAGRDGGRDLLAGAAPPAARADRARRAHRQPQRARAARHRGGRPRRGRAGVAPAPLGRGHPGAGAERGDRVPLARAVERATEPRSAKGARRRAVRGRDVRGVRQRVGGAVSRGGGGAARPPGRADRASGALRGDDRADGGRRRRSVRRGRPRRGADAARGADPRRAPAPRRGHRSQGARRADPAPARARAARRGGRAAAARGPLGGVSRRLPRRRPRADKRQRLLVPVQGNNYGKPYPGRRRARPRRCPTSRPHRADCAGACAVAAVPPEPRAAWPRLAPAVVAAAPAPMVVAPPAAPASFPRRRAGWAQAPRSVPVAAAAGYAPDLQHAWLEAIERVQSRAVEAHATFQRSLVESHQAFLRSTEASLFGLAALAGEAAAPGAALPVAFAPPPHLQVAPAPAPVMAAPRPPPAPVHTPAPAAVPVAPRAEAPVPAPRPVVAPRRAPPAPAGCQVRDPTALLAGDRRRQDRLPGRDASGRRWRSRPIWASTPSSASRSSLRCARPSPSFRPLLDPKGARCPAGLSARYRRQAPQLAGGRAPGAAPRARHRAAHDDCRRAGARRDGPPGHHRGRQDRLPGGDAPPRDGARGRPRHRLHQARRDPLRHARRRARAARPRSCKALGTALQTLGEVADKLRASLPALAAPQAAAPPPAAAPAAATPAP